MGMMDIDIQKIIEAFDEAKTEVWNDDDYFDIGYNNGIEEGKNIVLAMLKEQEAVEPIPPEDEFGLYRCGKCHHQLFRCVDKYCSRCGKSVKWE